MKSINLYMYHSSDKVVWCLNVRKNVYNQVAKSCFYCEVCHISKERCGQNLIFTQFLTYLQNCFLHWNSKSDCYNAKIKCTKIFMKFLLQDEKWSRLQNPNFVILQQKNVVAQEISSNVRLPPILLTVRLSRCEVTSIVVWLPHHLWGCLTASLVMMLPHQLLHTWFHTCELPH